MPSPETNKSNAATGGSAVPSATRAGEVGTSQAQGSGSHPLTHSNLATHQRASTHTSGPSPMDRWLLDPDDRLVRQRVAKYWAELLAHDDVAKAIQEVRHHEPIHNTMPECLSLCASRDRGRCPFVSYTFVQVESPSSSISRCHFTAASAVSEAILESVDVRLVANGGRQVPLWPAMGPSRKRRREFSRRNAKDPQLSSLTPSASGRGLPVLVLPSSSLFKAARCLRLVLLALLDFSAVFRACSKASTSGFSSSSSISSLMPSAFLFRCFFLSAALGSAGLAGGSAEDSCSTFGSWAARARERRLRIVTMYSGIIKDYKLTYVATIVCR
ncbi:hypothetical protein M409DRAFT_51214 [Zasmidium cellare ATCC 36951]|uniref:Uncharacterized protein n=1 Tax=Zasmidium cellare ATCC 36951 TaxID=1080233 RepID=A0A6A6CUY1_ZASCE|nr:uncharacterized protein M409DRAFT_51214 [Zasmidium cellare ATCC 36951]KAF2170977.1 hypothetical protein M409DRAFT_51214 [Zasmidium cellare ATCC 36951]